MISFINFHHHARALFSAINITTSPAAARLAQTIFKIMDAPSKLASATVCVGSMISTGGNPELKTKFEPPEAFTLIIIIITSAIAIQIESS